jgi:glutathione peroxidase
VFAKTSVVSETQTGSFLTRGDDWKPPRFNFHKYLLDRARKPVVVFESAAEPEDRRVTTQTHTLLVRIRLVCLR